MINQVGNWVITEHSLFSYKDENILTVRNIYELFHVKRDNNESMFFTMYSDAETYRARIKEHV